MGGMGSGREAEVFSGTVEKSLQIDVNKLVRDGAIGRGCQAEGTIIWKRNIGPDHSIGFQTYCYGENGHMHLIYKVSSLAMGEQAISYTIELYTTKPHFGGLRWWFICPNLDCNRMVSKLYQPPGATHFLCRTCQNLTYQSCRDSGKSDPFIEAIAKDTGLSIKKTKKLWKQITKQDLTV
jgi:hypothetical protein